MFALGLVGEKWWFLYFDMYKVFLKLIISKQDGFKTILYKKQWLLIEFLLLSLLEILVSYDCLLSSKHLPFRVIISHFRKRCGICTKLMEKTLEQVQRSSGVFIVKFEHILRLFLVFLLLTWEKKLFTTNPSAPKLNSFQP